METTFDYLNKVHGDLLAAADRERSRRVEPRRPGRPTKTLVAIAASILAVAGAVGYLSQGGGSSLFDAAGGNDSGGSSAGSTGGSADGPAAATPAPAVRGSFDTDKDVNFTPGNAATGATGGTGANGDEPRIIRTADISLVIPPHAFEQRFGDASDIAETNGGYVADSRTQTRSGSLVIRVPAARFDRTLRALRALGTVEVQSLHGRDVTADYVDLQARIQIAESRRHVLLRLMDQAVSIEQTIRVENALDETQLRIEQLQGQLNLLNDQTSLATITVSLREQGVQPQTHVEKPSIPNALERSVAGFVGVIAAIVIGLGYLLPVGLIALVWWFVAVRLRRRREAS